MPPVPNELSVTDRQTDTLRHMHGQRDCLMPPVPNELSVTDRQTDMHTDTRRDNVTA